MSTALALTSATLAHETHSGDLSFVDTEHTLLVVVWSGRARLRRPDGEEIVVGAGSVILLPRRQQLVLRSVEQLELSRLCFDAARLLPEPDDREALGAFDVALSDAEPSRLAVVGLPARHTGAVSDALGRIEAELREPRLGHELLLRARLLELIVTIARAEHTSERDPERHRARLERTLSLIHERYGEPLTLSALAKHAGMSISRFSCVFREVLGTSPLDYVAATRMREARRRLRTPGQSIAEVAYAVGFQDSNYFSRAFRQHHGMSPREFRDVARVSG